jgi:Arc/MetJ-type ribon-helix-helix transcriptional regulator
MAERTVALRLNQQQLELIDRTIAKGEAADRAALVRRALREQGEKANAKREPNR